MTPKHVAIIMDGNRRWASEQNFSESEGWNQGIEQVELIADEAAKCQLDTLTLFAFSTENWKRPEAQISGLLNLVSNSLNQKIVDLHAKNYQVSLIGSPTPTVVDENMKGEGSKNTGLLPKLNLIDQVAKFSLAEKMSQIRRRFHNQQRDLPILKHPKLRIRIALDYGGRWDIVQAAKALALKVEQGESKASDINYESFAKQLSTDGFPEVDLLIRTGGEKRVSNFLLWDCAYSELYFSDEYWPAFGIEQWSQALEEFAKRQRKFGR